MRRSKGKVAQFLFCFACIRLFTMPSDALCTDSIEVVIPQDGTNHDLRRQHVPFEIGWTFGAGSTGEMSDLISDFSTSARFSFIVVRTFYIGANFSATFADGRDRSEQELLAGIRFGWMPAYQDPHSFIAFGGSINLLNVSIAAKNEHVMEKYHFRDGAYSMVPAELSLNIKLLEHIGLTLGGFFGVAGIYSVTTVQFGAFAGISYLNF
jgi:hypothetical protein